MKSCLPHLSRVDIHNNNENASHFTVITLKLLKNYSHNICDPKGILHMVLRIL